MTAVVPASPATTEPPCTAALCASASVSVLRLAGELTDAALPVVQSHLDQMGASELLILELSQLRRIDDAGRRLLERLERHCRVASRRVVTRGATGQVASALAGTPLTSPLPRPAAPVPAARRTRWSGGAVAGPARAG